MKKLPVYILLFVCLFLLSSCATNDTTPKENVLSTIKTTQTKTYASGAIKEVLFFENNRLTGNIGITAEGDTLKYPKLLYIKSLDSLFVFVPVKYKNADILFAEDSLNVIHNKLKFGYFGVKKSGTIFLVPQMYTNDHEIEGVIKCKDTLTNEFYFYPFEVRTD